MDQKNNLIIERAIQNHDIPVDWPEGLEDELDQIQSSAGTGKNDRLDLRGMPFVTIDGADARDFDDAVFGQSEQDGWKLWVAIADVSYFVPLDSRLDQVAQRRGNSVYFPSRVVPMLPEILSNDLCSLIPGQDRYAMVCQIRINKLGQIRSSLFHQAIISSQARLTYDAVQGYLDGGVGPRLGLVSREIRKSLDDLCGIVQALTIERKNRGSIDLEIPEARIKYSNTGEIENICRVYRNDAHRLIEECMLAANLCAAHLLEAKPVPALFRLHEEPASEDIVSLRQSLAGFGLTMSKKSSPSAGDLAEVLRNARNEAALVDMIQLLLLRSMKQAVYSATKGPHFALGYPVYTHFTSPIRRYPDLVVHRLLKKRLGWKQSQKENEHPADTDLADIAAHCSHTERRAESAEREVTRQLTAEFMQKKIGLQFAGVVSGVTEFGVFVQLNDFPIDGLIHVSKLGLEYFLFDGPRSQLTGQTSGRVWRLGDVVRVIVSQVDLGKGRIDFSLTQNNGKSVQSEGQRNHPNRSRRTRKTRRQAVD
jgi:ribonuclease R